MGFNLRSSLRPLSAWSGLVLMTNPAVQPNQGGWTVIQPLHAQYQVAYPQKVGDFMPSFLVFFKDPSGAPVYKFECHAGGYDDESEMKWTGAFQCALFPFRGDTVTPVNLLAMDTRQEQSDDGWNRGRLLAKQLQSPCTDFPEYSTLRHFRLRGMDVTLAYTDIAWTQGPKGPELQKLTFTLDATPDKDAKTPQAAAAAGSSPPGECYP